MNKWEQRAADKEARENKKDAWYNLAQMKQVQKKADRAAKSKNFKDKVEVNKAMREARRLAYKLQYTETFS